MYYKNRVIEYAADVIKIANEEDWASPKLRKAIIELAEYAGMETSTAADLPTPGDHEIMIMTDCQFEFNDIVEYVPDETVKT